MKFKPENTVLLDLKGLIMYAMHRGTDPDAVLDHEDNPVNTAGYGFNVFLDTTLLPILEVVAPRRIVAIWDKGEHYRTGIFPKYKAKRRAREKNETVEKEMNALFEQVEKFMLSIGCTICFAKEIEADDVIAMLNKKIRGRKQIWTVDADLLQMSDDETMVLLRGDYVQDEHKGVPLELTTLNKSLVGDTSDEYPGVKGFGPKAWDEIILMFGKDGMLELEKCVQTKDFSLLEEAAAESGNKKLQMILDNKYEWALQYDIARLHPELCFGTHGGKLSKMSWLKRVPNTDDCRHVMDKMGALDLMPKIAHFLPEYHLITNDNMKELIRVRKLISESPFNAFDYESVDELKNELFNKAHPKGNYVDVLSQKITGASFTFGDNHQHTVYISVNHADTDNVPRGVILDTLDQIVTEENDLVVQNANFEVTVTDTNYGVRLPTPIDTAILASYVDENEPNNLKAMSKHFLKYEQATYAETLGDKADMAELTGEEVLSYGCDDSVVTAHLADLFYYILQTEDCIDFPLENDMEAMHPLVDSFEAGVPIDYERMSEIAADDQITIDEGTTLVRKLLGEHCSEYNKDAAAVLYKDLADFEKKKMLHNEEPEEKIEAKKDQLWDKIKEGSKYRPMIETKKEVEFIPAKGGLNEVAGKVGIDIEIPGATSNKINLWMADTDDIKNDLSDEGRKFRELLAPASDFLRSGKREGPEYEALNEFCTEILQRDAGVVISGDELNFGSPAQMQILLYCKLGLPIRMRSKVQRGSMRDKLDMHGSPGTDEDAIQLAMAEDTTEGDWKRDLLKAVLDIKECSTRFSLYYNKYPMWSHPRDGRVHGGIKNCGTVTRRPTGSSPNFLQVSKRKGHVRETFLPQKDFIILDGYRHDIQDGDEHVIVSADFAGQELRIMTSESKDPVLLDAYIGPNPKDIHSVTASAIGRIIVERDHPEELAKLELDMKTGGILYESFEAWRTSSKGALVKILKDIRNMAKAVNFLIIYGGGYTTLAKRLMIPGDLAKLFIQDVMATYARIVPWQEETVELAMTQGYVTTAYGTRRHIAPLMKSAGGYDEHRLGRQAVNSTIQGCAADMLKVVLREIHTSRLFHETRSVMLAPIYDEIAASVPKPAVIEYCTRLKTIMEVTPPGHQVPMLAEFSIGRKNWGKQVELGAVIVEDEFNEALYGEAA